jgi:hypothetical protein
MAPGFVPSPIRLAAALILSSGLLVAHPTAPTAWAGNGQLILTVIDKDTRKPIPCRIHLNNAAGKPRKADKMPFWQDHFVFPGQVTLRLPTGNYFFELERGPEYIDCRGHFTIENFADDTKEVELQRFVDMSRYGWWSGDLEVRRPAADLQLLMEAEDLHVAPLLTWWNDKDLADGKTPKNLAVQFDKNRYAQLMAGGHARAGGTLLFFNLPKPLLLGGDNPEYPLPATFIGQARKQPGAWIDLSKPFWWDLPALVAHQQIDSIQLAHSHICRSRVIADEANGKARDKMLYPGAWGNARWSHDIYFHLLNCGLRIPPTAGSGSGVVPNPVGYNRMYVHVEGEFSYEKWWENLKAGRVTVTNGPLLRPKVHGELPGHVFRGEKGQTLDFEIGLTLSTREPISYLELIKDGQVAHSIRFSEYAKSGKLPKLEFTQSGWFLVRAVTDVQPTYRFAMTGPYYVEFDDAPRISRRSVQFFVDWLYQRARQIKLDDPAQRQEVLQYHREARDYWQALLSRANAE